MTNELQVSDELTALLSCPCGGFYTMSATWQRCQIFHCHVCGNEIAAREPESYRPLYEAKEQARRVAEEERRAALPPPPPAPPPLRKATLLEAALIAAYGEWSEEFYSASWMSVGNDVSQFRQWLENKMVEDESEAALLRLMAPTP